MISIVSILRHVVVCQWPRKLCDAQVCYLREPLISTFSAYCSLKTVGAMPTIFIYVVQLIYTTLQTKFESNNPCSLLVTCTQNLSDFMYLYFSLNSSLHKMHLPINCEYKPSYCEWIPMKFGTPLAQSSTYLSPNFEQLPIKLVKI